MKIIYNSILDDLIDAQRAAEENLRSIKGVELWPSEWRQLLNELHEPYREPKEGDQVLGMPITVLTHKVLKDRIIAKNDPFFGFK